jgi:hypothetical protein
LNLKTWEAQFSLKILRRINYFVFVKWWVLN